MSINFVKFILKKFYLIMLENFFKINVIYEY